MLSLVIFPKRVSVCFIQGKHLPDPDHLLVGDGNQVRFIRLDPQAAILDTPPLRALVSEAIALRRNAVRRQAPAGDPFDQPKAATPPLELLGCSAPVESGYA